MRGGGILIGPIYLLTSLQQPTQGHMHAVSRDLTTGGDYKTLPQILTCSL